MSYSAAPLATDDGNRRLEEDALAREPAAKFAALARLTRHRENAVVAAEHVFDDREAQAHPAIFPGPPAVHAKEPFRQPRYLVGGDPLPRI